jgi:chromate transport protein ChrA
VRMAELAGWRVTGLRCALVVCPMFRHRTIVIMMMVFAADYRRSRMAKPMHPPRGGGRANYHCRE